MGYHSNPLKIAIVVFYKPMSFRVSNDWLQMGNDIWKIVLWILTSRKLWWECETLNWFVKPRINLQIVLSKVRENEDDNVALTGNGS